ncbi:MAG: DUF397 domain-containing protein [Streptosporangiales bacterium]|jgi:hypothetical protein|nr:DUF397 domain-containing protein [Streptosporangiales bacterium]
MTESGTMWRKSSYSGGSGGQCVEVGQSLGVLVRDTKNDGTGPTLRFSPENWKRLTGTLR